MSDRPIIAVMMRATIKEQPEFRALFRQAVLGPERLRRVDAE